MKLSIVSTLYQSEPYIIEFHERVCKVARELVGEDFELILVNDGSPDGSLDLAIKLAQQDPHVLVVDLSRNFGHHKAIMTGLNHAIGERVFLIDSDLEESPEWIKDFETKMLDESSDMVYGIQVSRKGGFFERVTGNVFYKIFRSLTGIDQPDNIVTARLMTQRYVKALLEYREREINLGGLLILTGFHQSTLPVKKDSTSPTTYTTRRKLSHLINAITSFSSLPLIYTFYFGVFMCISAMSFICYLIGVYLISAKPVGGYTSLIVSVWFFSGLIIALIGIQGVYIAKMFSEVKQRPYTTTREIYGKNRNLKRFNKYRDGNSGS